MSFSGTQQKCKACDKTVHFIDQLSADGVTYHRPCFKCSHCNGQLSMSSYSSMEGVLYCKPHFEQLFRESGNFSKKACGKSQTELTKTPSKLSSMFSGTVDKCAVCTKTVYPLEKVTMEGEFSTSHASGVIMGVASSHPQTVLLWMAFFIASTTLPNCSRRRAATTTSPRLLHSGKMELQCPK